MILQEEKGKPAMTPDVSCNIQFVDATGEALVIGTPPSGQPGQYPPFGQYQMWAWFNGLGFQSQLAPAHGTWTGFVQASRGVGDQDDSANLPVSLGNPNTANSSLFQLFASSASNSAHFMYIISTPGSALPPHVILGVVLNNTFEATAPAGVQWQQLNSQTIQLGFPPALSLIVVDLDEIYDSETASVVYEATGANSLSANQLTDLYSQVIGYCYPNLTTLDYELTNVNFTNAPTPASGGQTLIGSQNFTNPENISVTDQINLTKELSETFTLSSGTTWGAGVEVSFSIPLPIDAEATISGTFEYENGEEAETSGSVAVGVAAEIEIPPGQWNVSAYVTLAQNYSASFTGTLQVTGTIAVPAAGLSSQSLNGTVLTNIMSNPNRNNGSQVAPFAPGPNSTTASVSGTISGTLAVNTSLVTTAV